MALRNILATSANVEPQRSRTRRTEFAKHGNYQVALETINRKTNGKKTLGTLPGCTHENCNAATANGRLAHINLGDKGKDHPRFPTLGSSTKSETTQVYGMTTEMILRNVARRMHESAQYKLQRKTQILQRVLGNVALCQQDYEANGQWRIPPSLDVPLHERTEKHSLEILWKATWAMYQKIVLRSITPDKKLPPKSVILVLFSILMPFDSLSWSVKQKWAVTAIAISHSGSGWSLPTERTNVRQSWQIVLTVPLITDSTETRIGYYIVDAFTLYAASAMTAASCLRSLAGFVFPLFAPAMYSALGFCKGDTVFAAVAIAIGCPACHARWSSYHVNCVCRDK
ncbi:hypothetical protein V8E55_001205 [Tylopilus felleus]